MCAQRLIPNNPPPAPRPFILLGSLLTSNIQPLTSAFPCAPLTHALALDSRFSHQSPACPEHQRRVTAHQSHAALSLFAGGRGVGCDFPISIFEFPIHKSFRMRSSAISRAKSFGMRSCKNAPLQLL